MFAGRQFFSWLTGSIYTRALISRGLQGCFAEASLTRFSSKAYPAPKAVKAAFLGCPWQSLRHLFSQLRQSISQHGCRIGLS